MICVRLAICGLISVVAAVSSDWSAVACAGKTYCREMRNCAEAAYYLQECGLGRLDRNKDGIPCERKCGKTTATFQRRLSVQSAGKSLSALFGSASGRKGQALGILQNPALAGSSFNCTQRKRYCREMNTCAEATYYLKTCGVKSLDGNRDGIACNSLCR